MPPWPSSWRVSYDFGWRAVNGGELCQYRHRQPLGDDRGLIRAFDLDRHVVAEHHFFLGALVHLFQPEAAANFSARLDRQDKADLVEAVIDAHGATFDCR